MSYYVTTRILSGTSRQADRIRVKVIPSEARPRIASLAPQPIRQSTPKCQKHRSSFLISLCPHRGGRKSSAESAPRPLSTLTNSRDISMATNISSGKSYRFSRTSHSSTSRMSTTRVGMPSFASQWQRRNGWFRLAQLICRATPTNM